MVTIKAVKARQIFDSRGNPTVEVEVVFGDGTFPTVSVPIGASTEKKHGEHPGKDEQSARKRDQKYVDQQKVVAKTPQEKKHGEHPGKVVAKTPQEIVEEVKKCKKKHKLESKKYNKPFKCSRCKEDGITLGYGCKLCDYDLHKECFNPEPKITHKFFPGSVFEFHEKPLECGRICDACGTRIYGCSYHCEAHGLESLDLHPRCGNLQEQLCPDGVDFVLISKNVKQRCFLCKKKRHSRLVEGKVPGWCYVSERNKFYCHVYCVSQMVQEAWRRGDLVPSDDDDNNDGASKALAKFDFKHLAKSNGSGDRGGRWFLKVATAIL